MEHEELTLSEIREHAYKISSHYLTSKHCSTNVSMVFLRSLLDTASRLTPSGSVAANGIDPVSFPAKVFAWADGFAAKVGDEKLCVIMLGALQKAQETLIRELEQNLDSKIGE
jgi:hypothetical protein